jgi:hypothetical protein
MLKKEKKTVLEDKMLLKKHLGMAIGMVAISQKVLILMDNGMLILASL